MTVDYGKKSKTTLGEYVDELAAKAGTRLKADIEGGAAKRTGASFARGQSKQDYETPAEFITAVVNRFGPLAWDLGATRENAKAPAFISPEQNSLAEDVTWNYAGNLWLNPPFDNIAPWAAKCAAAWVYRNRILLLIPASVGSVWYAAHVHDKAAVKFLSPRLCFDGKHPYPKDCLLAVYGDEPGYECWRWKP